MLEFAILGLLHQAPMHGYELRKELSTVLGGLRSISFGSLYPALKRMQAAALIAADDRDLRAPLPAGAPPLTGRRGKIVYALTPAGEERFAQLVNEAGPDAYDDAGQFGVHLANFAHTAADVRLRILEGRRRTVEQQRDGMRATLARTRERMDRYTLELQRHGLESVDREVRWLAELIDRERDAGTSPSTPPSSPPSTAPVPDDAPPGTGDGADAHEPPADDGPPGPAGAPDTPERASARGRTPTRRARPGGGRTA